MKPTLEDFGPGWTEFTPSGATPTSEAILISAAGEARRGRPNDASDEFDVPSSTAPAPEPTPQPAAGKSESKAPDAPAATPASDPQPATQADVVVTGDGAAEAEAEAEAEEIPDDLPGLLMLLQSLISREHEQQPQKARTKLEKFMAKVKSKLLFVQNASPVAPKLKHQSILGDLLARPDNRKLADEVISKWRAWRRVVAGFEERGLLPGSTNRQIEKLERASGACKSCDELHATATRIASLKSITPSLSYSAQLLTNKPFAAIETPYVALLDSVESGITALLKASQEAEEKFFSEHGLGREQTAVSKRFAHLLEFIAHERAGLSRFNGNDGYHVSQTRQWSPPFQLFGNVDHQ